MTDDTDISAYAPPDPPVFQLVFAAERRNGYTSYEGLPLYDCTKDPRSRFFVPE